MTEIHARGLTDPGLARQRNEDCFAVDSERRLYVVADGMGGHTHGEVASRISVDSICDFVSRNGAFAHRSPLYDPQLLPHSNLLKAAILAAQGQVVGAVNADVSLQGMGTTVVGLHVQDGIGAVAHVGDSRVYRLRDRQLTQLTEDHTWVNEQVAAGYLSAEEARTHPLRNVVTRALGGEAEVTVDVKEVSLLEDDLFLLCSDGLTGMLRDSEIGELLQADTPLQEVCQGLIDAANEKGGADNITVILVSIVGETR